MLLVILWSKLALVSFIPIGTCYETKIKTIICMVSEE